ncbi:MAG TPA: response regulator transcription factor [Burkholderiales bacterium]
MGYKILIVDDSKLARMAVNKALNTLYPDWVRLEAANADGAMSSLKEQQPDVALMDFNMPGQDGLELAAEFRRLHPRMPVGVISANHQQEVIDRARAAGASFLPKPLTEQALSRFLDEAVQQIEKGAS